MSPKVSFRAALLVTLFVGLPACESADEMVASPDAAEFDEWCDFMEKEKVSDASEGLVH